MLKTNLGISDKVSCPTDANINPKTAIIIAFKNCPLEEKAATAVLPTIHEEWETTPIDISYGDVAATPVRILMSASYSGLIIKTSTIHDSNESLMIHDSTRFTIPRFTIRGPHIPFRSPTGGPASNMTSFAIGT